MHYSPCLKSSLSRTDNITLCPFRYLSTTTIRMHIETSDGLELPDPVVLTIWAGRVTHRR